jgi:hypothetical protein
MSSALVEKLQYVCQLRRDGLITNDELIKANMIEAFFAASVEADLSLRDALQLIKKLEESALISQHLSLVARNSLAETLTRKWTYRL